MSNKPKRLVDEIFQLKRIIKEKDEEIKKLYRKLHNQEKAEKKAPKKVPEKEKPPSECPDCDNGKIKSTDLGFRNIVSCENCGYRKVTKK